MIDHQFYPTPPHLVEKAWNKFTESHVTALLEPSAGKGALIDKPRGYYMNSSSTTDCIEAMGDNIAVLKQKGLRVVDTDFLSFTTSKLYSHVILNPPFANGIDHVLKAWDILVQGELVAIINASTIENPNSEKRQFLVNLIDENGDVEFLDAAFTTDDTQRKTNVRVAIVHLTKTSLDAPLFDINTMGMTTDDTLSSFDEQLNEEKAHLSKQMQIPNSTIKNGVIAFNQAAEAIRAMIQAQRNADYYKSKISGPRHVMGGCSKKPTHYQSEFNSAYDDLKLNAWSNIINASDFTNKFSSKVIKDLEQELETIKHMEFTVRNIYGLLEGLLLNKGKLDNDMLLEVFDLITAYHTGNRSLYRGWKSNDKHRSRAFRMKHTRFILPTRTVADAGYFCYDNKRMIEDFDKVFALLDGKAAPEDPLLNVFTDKERYRDVCSGERVASSYFEVRFYVGTQSIHFFPTKKGKELVDRFNRTIGKLRGWLPDESTVSPEFWEQYEQAEKVTKLVENSLQYSRFREWELYHEDAPNDVFEEVHGKACEELDIPLFNRLENGQQEPGTQLALPVAV